MGTACRGRSRVAVCVAVALLAAPPRTAGTAFAETDLDAFMHRVLDARDENWKKLQQYVLDEVEQIQLTGPSRKPIWGDRRDYTWYIRDGFFVRSPTAVNGIAVGDAERRRYEQAYLQDTQQRDAGGALPMAADADDGADNFIRQARQPRFVSSAYFLRFSFEEGRYALVGHESLDGRDTLRIEY